MQHGIRKHFLISSRLYQSKKKVVKTHFSSRYARFNTPYCRIEMLIFVIGAMRDIYEADLAFVVNIFRRRVVDIVIQLYKECMSSHYLNSNNDSALSFFSICTTIVRRLARRIFVLTLLQRIYLDFAQLHVVYLLARDSRFGYFLQTRKLLIKRRTVFIRYKRSMTAAQGATI